MSGQANCIFRSDSPPALLRLIGASVPSMNAGVGCVPRGTLEEKFAAKEVQILLRVVIATLKNSQRVIRPRYYIWVFEVFWNAIQCANASWCYQNVTMHKLPAAVDDQGKMWGSASMNWGQPLLHGLDSLFSRRKHFNDLFSGLVLGIVGGIGMGCVIELGLLGDTS